MCSVFIWGMVSYILCFIQSLGLVIEKGTQAFEFLSQYLEDMYVSKALRSKRWMSISEVTMSHQLGINHCLVASSSWLPHILNWTAISFNHFVGSASLTFRK